MTYAIIMAGGSGTRFWPKSTADYPKQFLNLLGKRSLLQKTVERIAPLVSDERVIVVTRQAYGDLVRQQLPELSEDSVIEEPVARNTAPCVAASAQLLLNRDPNAVMIVLPADHQILDEKAFINVLQTAVSAAESSRSLVTIGLKPSRPETGYGYIHYKREPVSSENGLNLHAVREFREKPDEKTAKEFLASGDYLWNSGMFVWRADVILEAFRTHQPGIYQLLDYLRGDGDLNSNLRRFYEEAPSVSIDYAIMENAEDVKVIPAEVGWSDLGSWKVAHELAEKDANENSIEATHSSVHDSAGNLVRLADKKKVVALVGVENLAIIETEDALLVCDLDKSQDVRKVIEEFKGSEKLKRFL